MLWWSKAPDSIVSRDVSQRSVKKTAVEPEIDNIVDDDDDDNDNEETKAVDWDLHYAALIEYSKEYGDCNIPLKKSYECLLKGLGANGTDLKYSRKLGRWLDTQRVAKRGTRSDKNLSKDRELKLQALVDQGNKYYIIFFLNLY